MVEGRRRVFTAFRFIRKREERSALYLECSRMTFHLQTVVEVIGLHPEFPINSGVRRNVSVLLPPSRLSGLMAPAATASSIPESPSRSLRSHLVVEPLPREVQTECADSFKTDFRHEDMRHEAQ